MLTIECPACKGTVLQKTTLEDNLPVSRCPKCEGIWVDSNEYLTWTRTQRPQLSEKQADDPAGPIWDTQELKLCPSCSRILTRFRVVPDVEFHVERCKHCSGVWFDRDEWELLVARNLHDKVNQFFTQPWQSKIREEETKQRLEKLYLAKFGAEDYARVRETWEWLESNPQQAMLLAFLQAEDPYKI